MWRSPRRYMVHNVPTVPCCAAALRCLSSSVLLLHHQALLSLRRQHALCGACACSFCSCLAAVRATHYPLPAGPRDRWHRSRKCRRRSPSSVAGTWRAAAAAVHAMRLSLLRCLRCLRCVALRCVALRCVALRCVLRRASDRARTRTLTRERMADVRREAVSL